MVPKCLMLKNRILALFSVVFVLCLCVAPAFAADNNSSVVPLYATLPFDYVSTGSCVYAWPSNVGYEGQTESPSPFRYVDVLNGYFYTEFWLGSNTLNFYCSELVWDAGKTTGVFDSPYDDVRFTYARVSYNVMSMERYSSAQSYKAVIQETIDKTIDLQGAHRFDLAAVLQAAYNPTGVVFISDLRVELSFYFESGDSDPFIGFTSRGIDSRPTFASWINSRLLYYTVTKAEFGSFDWLIDNANSILELKIAPDLSLNSVNYILLAVGVLFWLFKMSS